MVNAQTWLDKNYPQEERSKITKLDISYQYQNLIGALDLSDFVNLTTLYCYNNLLTTLDVTKNKDLIELYCDNNKLTTLDVSKNKGLTILNCSHNPLTNLNCQSNSQLKTLDISNTDLTQDWEHYPDNISQFKCSADEQRPNSKVKIIAQQLSQYGQPEYNNFANPLLLAKRALRERDKSIQQVKELQEQIQELQKELLEKPGDESTQLTKQIQSLQIELAQAEGELKVKSEEISHKNQTTQQQTNIAFNKS